uniref:C-type lectin domain-containing protein n=1 Tax=Poecilia reticulata TaxID=8081 RepID=A0A3P9PGL8_POERE
MESLNASLQQSHETHLSSVPSLSSCLCVPGSSTGPCCPPDWTRFGSDCYFFSQQQLNWNQSQSWCERKSAHLVILHSDQEWDFVTKKSVPLLYWVGLTDWRTGRWEWVNQTPYSIERRRWVPGQPDAWTGHGMGPEDEDCAHLHSNGRLNDIHCSTGLSSQSPPSSVCV